MSESPHIFTVDSNNFESVVIENSQRVPVFVDFWAAWCQPCQVLMPMLSKLAEEYNGAFILAKVNSDEQQELAAQYGVRSLPTIKMFKNGQVVDEFMGALPESEIRRYIDKHIIKESDILRDKARAALNNGDEVQAVELLKEAESKSPDDTSIQTDLAMMDARAGKVQEALARLESLPFEARQTDEVIQLMARLEFANKAAAHPDVAELKQRIEANPNDCEALYYAATHDVLAGHYQSALDHFLQVMKTNREFMDDGGRKGLLDVFKILGDEHELTGDYRRKLFNILH